MKIAAVVILFNPDEKVFGSIQSYYPYMQKLYVIDNSEQASAIKDKIDKTANAIYIHDGENKGISIRLNDACARAIADGFDFLLTMDQDSFFEKHAFEDYLKCLETIDKNEVAMLGITYGGMAVDTTRCSAKNVHHLITSGSIVNVDLYKCVGGFDENLFIDEVDLEYCYRARSKGFKIVRFTNIYLQHNLGTKTTGISLKSFKSTPRAIHSPLRMYYMVRNYFYVKKKYPELHLLDEPERRNGILNRIKNNVLYGKNRVLLIKLIIKAYLDCKNKKMGKFVTEP